MVASLKFVFKIWKQYFLKMCFVKVFGHDKLSERIIISLANI